MARDYVPGYYAPGGSLRDLSRGSPSVAEMIIARGDQQAAGALRGGDVWANAIAHIGQQLSAGIEQWKKDHEDDEGDSAIKRALLSDYPSATQPKPAGTGMWGGGPASPTPEEQAASQSLPPDLGGQQPVAAPSGASAQAADPGMNHIQAILDSVPPAQRARVIANVTAVQTSAQKVREERLKIDETQNRVDEGRRALEQKANDHWYVIANGLEEHLGDPDGGIGAAALGAGLSAGVPGEEQIGQFARDAMTHYAQAPDEQSKAAVAEAFRQQAAPLIEQGKRGGSLEAQKSWAETQKALAEADKARQPPKPEKPPAVGSFEDHVLRYAKEKGVTPQQLTAKDIEDARKRYQQADDRPKVNVTVGPDGGIGTLDKDGLELAATAYRLTKALPARNAEQNGAIISAAAKQAKMLGNSPVATIQKQAAYAGDAKAMAKMQSMSAAAESFEAKAIGQADIISQLSSKVGRTQFPLINQAILAGKGQFGDKDTQLLYNAISTFSAEYAKIMEGSTGSAAGSSDSARAAAGRLISAKLNNDTLQATLDLMKKEMRLTIGGYDATIAHISERMGGAPSPHAASPASSRYKVEVVQ